MYGNADAVFAGASCTMGVSKLWLGLTPCTNIVLDLLPLKSSLGPAPRHSTASLSQLTLGQLAAACKVTNFETALGPWHWLWISLAAQKGELRRPHYSNDKITLPRVIPTMTLQSVFSRRGED